MAMKPRNRSVEISEKFETRRPKAPSFCPTVFAALFPHLGSRLLLFGFRISALLAYFGVSSFAAAAETNGASDLPASSLQPPRGEIPPSFWEQYGTWIILASLLLLCWIALGVWLMARPKPLVPV